MQRDVTGLENGSNLHGELLTALVALVGADPGALAFHLGNSLHAAAMRADRTLRPQPGFEVRIGGFLIMEVLGG